MIIAPNSGTVLLGNTLTFSATVANTTDTSVYWSVNGISGGSPQVGTITADGLFTAPADFPPGGKVQVTATSHADSSKSSTAGVAISSDIAVTLSPVSSSVELGALQSFHAAITSSGKPDPAIHWSLSGPACPNNCGTVDANGNYTAPAVLPSAPAVTLTAISVADPSKQTSTTVTITSYFTLQVSAPSNLQPGVTSAIVATLTPVPGSSPSAVLSWSVSGSGNACGQQPDAPLSGDDRTGLRVLYHDPADTQFVGSIQGRILPANPLSLPASPSGVTGVFAAHVVAVDAASGSVIAGTLGGWSCQAPGPAQFDGTYQIGALAVNHSYKIYAKPLNGAVGPSEVSKALVSLCRNSTTDPGWPPLQSCVVPQPNLEFTAATRPSS